MELLIGLLVFVVVYAVAKLLLSKIPSLAEIADIVALIIAALVALGYVGA